MSTVTDDNLHFGTLPNDPTGVSDCGTCNGSGVKDGDICPSCLARQEIRNAWWESSGGPERLRRALGL